MERVEHTIGGMCDPGASLEKQHDEESGDKGIGEIELTIGHLIYENRREMILGPHLPPYQVLSRKYADR